MAVANYYTSTGQAKGEVNLPEGAFGIEPNRHVMWEAVRNYLANQRQGTAKVKTRAEVSGGGRKPWRQKGTGRARAGTTRGPLWVGGGRAFGPKPRDYGYVLPKQTKRLALRSALSAKAQAGEVLVISDFRVTEPKTREVAQILKSLSLDEAKCLLVVPEHDAELARAGRNIPALTTRECRLLNTYEVLQAERLLIMESALAKIEEAWKS
jgi:large subunit ribosomal protein L4